MDDEYFSEIEAKEKIGRVVETLETYKLMPRGSGGTVIDASSFGNGRWIVGVKWDVTTQEKSYELEGGIVTIDNRHSSVSWYSKTAYLAFFQEVSY